MLAEGETQFEGQNVADCPESEITSAVSKFIDSLINNTRKRYFMTWTFFWREYLTTVNVKAIWNFEGQRDTGSSQNLLDTSRFMKA